LLKHSTDLTPRVASSEQRGSLWPELWCEAASPAHPQHSGKAVDRHLSEPQPCPKPRHSRTNWQHCYFWYRSLLAQATAGDQQRSASYTCGEDQYPWISHGQTYQGAIYKSLPAHQGKW